MITNKTPSKRPHLNEIKFKNNTVLLRLLSSGKCLSRYDLATQSGLTQMAVSRLVKGLIKMEICYEDKHYEVKSKLGRRRVGLRINPDGGYVASACLSAFSKIVAISDISKQKRYSSEIPDSSLSNPEDACNFICSFIDKTFKNHQLKRTRLLGAGVVVAGSINSEDGHLVNAPLLNWNDFPMKAHLEKKMNCSVVVENIADALCQTCPGFEKSNKVNPKNILLVHNAAGMGASLSIEGKIFRKHADESWIGKIPLTQDTNSSTAIKTLSSVSSGHAVLQETKVNTHTSYEFADCLNLAIIEASNGNTSIQQAFYNAGHSLGLALFPLTVAYLPDWIVLAGPTGTNSFFEAGVRDGYRKFSEKLEIPCAKIRILKTSYIDASQEIALQKFFINNNELDVKLNLI